MTHAIVCLELIPHVEEVFREGLLRDWLPIYPNPLPNRDQVRGGKETYKCQVLGTVLYPR